MSTDVSHTRPLGRRVAEALLPAIFFLLLSAIFLWQPILTGRVFLPTDLSYRYDYAWKPYENTPGLEVAQNPVLSDVSLYYYPYASYAIDRLRDGDFPFWNPYIMTGTPFFASAQAAVLDPINLLTFTAGPLAYWTWGAWLRLALMGFTTYGFARSLGRSVMASLAAGAIFMVCGFVVPWLNYNVVTSLSWMPMMFWATTRLLQTHRLVWLAATAFAMGGLFMGGHPETQFLVGLAWAFYCLYYLVALRNQPPQGDTRSIGMLARHRFLLLTAATVLGIGLGAAQIVAFLAFLFTTNAMTERISIVDPFDIGQSAIRLAVLFFPNFSGTPLRRNYWVYFTNFNEQSGYIGLLAVALAALGALYWWRRDRLVPFFGVTMLLTMLLAIRAPGLHLIKALPLFNIGQGVRWAIVWSLCGAILAAFGIDAILKMRARSGRLCDVGLGFLSAALAGFAILFLLYIGIKDYRWDESWNTVTSHEEMANLFHPARLMVYWPVIFLGAGALALLALWRGFLSHRVTVALIVLLLYADLWALGSRYNPSTPSEAIYPMVESISYVQQRAGRDRMIGTGSVLVTNTSMLFGLRNLQGYEDVVEARFTELYNPLLLGELFGRFGQAKRDGSRISLHDHRLLQVGAVRYVMSSQRLTLEDDRKVYKFLFNKDRVTIYENLEALPRAYVVFNATIAPDHEAATSALLAPTHDPLRSVVLTAAGQPLSGSDLDARAVPVTWHADTPEEARLEVTLPAPGYLVLSDNYTPDWQATVNNQPATVLRANVAYRAVALPAGRSMVSFYYRPWPVYIALGVSALSLLTILGIAVTHLIGARRKAEAR